MNSKETKCRTLVFQLARHVKPKIKSEFLASGGEYKFLEAITKKSSHEKKLFLSFIEIIKYMVYEAIC